MKFLLLLALFCLVLWLLRRMQLPRSNNPPSSQRQSERMLACAYCGVNHPLGESIVSRGKHYCCESHQLAAESIEE